MRFWAQSKLGRESSEEKEKLQLLKAEIVHKHNKIIEAIAWDIATRSDKAVWIEMPRMQEG